MGLLKWIFCAVFLATVLSDEVPEEPMSIEIKHSDLLKIFPDQKEKLRNVVEQLQNATAKEQVAILNDYTDDCLENLNKFIIEISLDPVKMPDIVEEFEWKVGFIKYHGIMSLTGGWLQGIASMQRSGDVTLSYAYPYVKIRSPLGLKNILFNYDYKAKFMGLGPSGGVDGRVDGCKFTFDLDINMITLRATLDNFKVNTLGKISLKFTGNVLVDWMLNIFVSVTIPMVKPIIRLVVQGTVTSIFTGIVDVWNNFICQLLADCVEQVPNLIL